MQRQKAVIAAVLGLVLGGTALAQEQRQDHSRDRQNRPRATEQDRHDGDRDAARNRQWQQNQQWRQNDRDDRDRDQDRNRDRASGTYQAYPNGTYYPNGAYYPNGRYPVSQYPSGTYGMYGGANSALSQAQQIGYTDGMNDARTDMAAGRGYQPTNDANYRHANRGWNRNMVDQGSFQQAYRQAYLQGYQQAYGQGGYGWPR